MGTIKVTESNFDQVVGASSVPVLVDFWADWCPPCRQMDPVIDQLNTELAPKAKVAKVDIEKYPRLARRFAVTSIPAFLVFWQGQEVARLVGPRPKHSLIAQVERFISDSPA